MPFKIKKTVSVLGPSGNSVQFNGTNQYLTAANNSAFQLNTGNFTIEGWIYVTAFPSSVSGNDLTSICDKDGIQGSTYSSYSIRCTNSSGVIKLKADCNTSSGGGSTGAVTSTTTINTGTWYHFAYVRNGATAYLYINGNQEASAGIVDFYTTTNALYIGYQNNAVSRFYWPGYISNFRIVKGTALYTASFAAPTAPLTTIASCSLLTCQSPTIVDNSGNNFAITNNNAATVSSAVTPFSSSLSPFKVKKNNPNPTMLTGYGASFNGSSQYLNTPSNAAFAFGTGDFTVEYFMSASTAQNVTIFDTRTNSNNTTGYSDYLTTANKFTIWLNPSIIYTSTASLTYGTWNHIAVSRQSSTLRVFINGAYDGSISNSTNFSDNGPALIGTNQNKTSYFVGNVSNLRVLKGVALYTASFTVPTSPLTAITSCSLLTCHAATISDGSSNNFTVTNNSGVVPSSSFTPFSSSLTAPTNYSVVLNGTNQNLRIANNAALQFGTGDFTVDFWLYGNSSQAAYARALSIGGTYGGSQIGLEIDIQGSSGLIMEVNSGASTVTSIVIYAPSTWKNQWNHIAVTRVGTTFYAFYNGTLAGSVTPASINLIGTDGVSIGCSTANANYWNGYISNLRLVKGTALYTASFTPSTTPLTAISGTSLLTCNSATIVDNSSNNFAITNNNTATVSSTITPFVANVLNSGFKLKQVSYVRPA